MRKTPILLTILCIAISCSVSAQQPSALTAPFEQDSNRTATYQETIAFYETLSVAFPQLKLQPHGNTDAGFPLHTAVLSSEGAWQPETAKAQGKTVVFINNAIHPGEPCGVDATMILLRNWLQDPKKMELLDRLVIVVVPFYNIGGGLNRGAHSRANQNGPEAHGFRGNARNLDLNRDFIKADSRNAQTFNQVFSRWQPDLFVDNHTSNGADYQYTITLIPTQSDKLDPNLASYLDQQLLPGLYEDMKADGWEMTPYVYARSTPDEGIAAFLDLPRYSTGYAALHNAIGFMPETHMLKPFKDRVMSTYTFMNNLLTTAWKDHETIQAARSKAITNSIQKDSFALSWTLDQNRQVPQTFKGYAAKYKPSDVSGLERLYYDRSAPYTKEIPYFKFYNTSSTVKKPRAYLIPQAYYDVLDRLQWNGVSLFRLTKDRSVEVEMYRIADYKDRAAYEGHYLHYNTTLETETTNITYKEGDYVIFTDQPANRYIIETLEPHAPDSFFSWNFFDGILMQKEYFSAYVFEDKAAMMLANDPELEAALEARRADDPEFAKSARAQLNFIYERSPHYEPTHRRYPVSRLMEEIDLPVQRVMK
ncbi:MAG: hypothetical protein KI786_04835 [Mameliella sp.]|nr:hypothetical protein [Phaeodactylibacter sp.]